MDLDTASRTQRLRARRQAKRDIGIIIGNTYYLEFVLPNDIWTHVAKYLDRETLFSLRFVNRYLRNFISGYSHVDFEQYAVFNKVVKHVNTGIELQTVFNAIDNLRKSDDVHEGIRDRKLAISTDCGVINVYDWWIHYIDPNSWHCRHCIQSRIFSVTFSAGFRELCWIQVCRNVCYKCGALVKKDLQHAG